MREIDALGGLMGLAIDATAIQFKLLNRSRGPAVWSPRRPGGQEDLQSLGQVGARRGAEHRVADRAGRPGADTRRTDDRPGDGGRRDAYTCRALVLTTGTFLNGLIHIGEEQHPAGTGRRTAVVRARQPRSTRSGFTLGGSRRGRRRAWARASIDFARQIADGRFAVERGDDPPVPFSFLSAPIARPQIDCYLLHTNDRVRDLVRANIDRSPLFNGQIQGHRAALLPVDRGQDRPVPGQGAASDFPGA